MSSVIYDEIILSSLFQYSVSKDYNQIKKEWSYNGEVIDNGPIKDQIKKVNCALCGHPIRYEYIITNKENKKKIGIGSECINNFLNIDITRLKKDIKINQTKNKKDSLNNFLSLIRQIGNKMYQVNKEQLGIVDLNQSLKHIEERIKTDNISDVNKPYIEMYCRVKPQKEVIDKLYYRYGYMSYPKEVISLLPELIKIAEFYQVEINQDIINNFLKFHN